MDRRILANHDMTKRFHENFEIIVFSNNPVYLLYSLTVEKNTV